MNAKFEKWCDDQGYLKRASFKRHMFSAWNGSIQSLELTPELLDLAHDDYEGIAKHTANNIALEAAITAVFNAIKEQAK